MAKEKKSKNEIFRTPAGVLKYPRLGPEPDYGTQEFPKEAGEFNTKIILSAEAMAQVRKKLDPLHKAALEKGREAFNAKPKAKREKSPFIEHPYYSPVYDENEEETGEFEMSFKTKASGVSKKTGKKWTRRPPRFDAKRNPLPDSLEISGGSTAKVSFSASDFFMDANNMAGLSLRLEGVQVLELVQGGQRSASSLGFEDEDGYSYDGSGSDDDHDTEEPESDEADDEDDGDF